MWLPQGCTPERFLSVLNELLVHGMFVARMSLTFKDIPQPQTDVLVSLPLFHSFSRTHTHTQIYSLVLKRLHTHSNKLERTKRFIVCPQAQVERFPACFTSDYKDDSITAIVVQGREAKDYSYFSHPPFLLNKESDLGTWGFSRVSSNKVKQEQIWHELDSKH